jgi:uncharacterized protein YhhL (DUF1145 family)
VSAKRGVLVRPRIRESAPGSLSPFSGPCYTRTAAHRRDRFTITTTTQESPLMQNFFLIGKLATLGFWILPVLAVLGVFAQPWDYRLLAIAFVIFLAHLGELVFVFGKLKAAGRAEALDVVMVILVGLFHWVPIVRKP